MFESIANKNTTIPPAQILKKLILIICSSFKLSFAKYIMINIAKSSDKTATTAAPFC